MVGAFFCILYLQLLVMTYPRLVLTAIICCIVSVMSFAQQTPTTEVKELVAKAKKHWGDSLQLLYLQQAEQIADQHNDTHGKGLVYQQMGSYYYSRKPDSCIYYQQKAYELLLKAGNKKMAAICLHSVGFTYDEMKHDYETALKYIEQSLPIHYELKDTMELGNMYKYTGMLQGKTGKYVPALKDIDSAFHYFLKAGYLEGIAVSFYDKAIVYKSAGNTDSALIFLSRAYHYWYNESKASEQLIISRLFNINNARFPLLVEKNFTKHAREALKENDDMLLSKNIYFADRLTHYKNGAGFTGKRKKKDKPVSYYLQKYQSLKDSLISKGIQVE